jgi:hypothetical protein
VVTHDQADRSLSRNLGLGFESLRLPSGVTVADPLAASFFLDASFSNRAGGGYRQLLIRVRS